MADEIDPRVYASAVARLFVDTPLGDVVEELLAAGRDELLTPRELCGDLAGAARYGGSALVSRVIKHVAALRRAHDLRFTRREPAAERRAAFACCAAIEMAAKSLRVDQGAWNQRDDAADAAEWASRCAFELGVPTPVFKATWTDALARAQKEIAGG